MKIYNFYIKNKNRLISIIINYMMIEINILKSKSNEICFFIQNAYQNNISSCTMLNHIFNSLTRSLHINDEIDINTIHLFVKNLILATSSRYGYDRVIMYYPKHEDLINFFKPILFIHKTLQVHIPLLELFPPELLQIILKYAESANKKVIILPQIPQRSRFSNWIKVGQNQWGRI
tara:strand:+ start:15970 stop:16497 length:528 start_codon:yes stop_codon:yes gene_type:complete